MNASIATLPDCSPNTANADSSEAAERLAYPREAAERLAITLARLQSVSRIPARLRSVLPSAQRPAVFEAGHWGRALRREHKGGIDGWLLCDGNVNLAFEFLVVSALLTCQQKSRPPTGLGSRTGVGCESSICIPPSTMQRVRRGL